MRIAWPMPDDGSAAIFYIRDDEPGAAMLKVGQRVIFARRSNYHGPIASDITIS